MVLVTMKLKPIAFLLGLTLLISLSGCGNKGPLTLPDDEKKTERKTQTISQQAT
ncbi:MAG: putative small lipoprotein YifL [Arenicella sp.]|jgi:predicted small lipoprotein YifL